MIIRFLGSVVTAASRLGQRAEAFRVRRNDRVRVSILALSLMTILFSRPDGVAGQTTNAGSGGSYQLVENWGQLPPGEQFGNITDVRVDANGLVYATRRCPVRCGYLKEGDPPGDLLVFDASGKFLHEWKGFVYETHGLYIDHDGFIWATDIQKDVVKKFRPDGTLVMTLGHPGVRRHGAAGEPPDAFNQPTHVVVVPPNDDIYVTDGYGGPTITTQRVVKFSKDGKFIMAWGNRGKAPGEFRVPHAISVDSRGRIYVADRCGRASEPPCTDGRVQIFDGNGIFLGQWTPPGVAGFNPLGIYIDKEDKLYIGDGENSRIWIVDTRTVRTSRQALSTLKVLETVDDARIKGMHHLVADSEGNIYTASLMGGLHKYSRAR